MRVLILAALGSACAATPDVEPGITYKQRMGNQRAFETRDAGAADEETAAAPVSAQDAGASDVDEAIRKWDEEQKANDPAPWIRSGPPEPVTVSVHDPETGNSETHEIDPDGQFVVENGVRVLTINYQPWCARSGSKRDMCGATRAECLQRFSSKCSSTLNAACFMAASRTTGQERAVCVATYGGCEQLRAVAEISREYEVSDDCVVMRYSKPAAKR
jgi:hypothetical protein